MVTTRAISINKSGAAQERISGTASYISTNIVLCRTYCLFDHPSALGVIAVQGGALWLMRCHDAWWLSATAYVLVVPELNSVLRSLPLVPERFNRCEASEGIRAGVGGGG